MFSPFIISFSTGKTVNLVRIFSLYKTLCFLAPTGALGVKMLSVCLSVRASVRPCVRASVWDNVQISTLEEVLRAKGPIERAYREGLKRGYKERA